MSTSTIDPYIVVIIPPKGTPGSYQWAILLNGRLVGRSRQNFSSEAKAREAAQAEIDKLLSETSDP